jgi:hypothetical protein
MCFEDEWRTATLAARQTYLYSGISGEFKLVRAPEKEYFLLIYRISAKDARKKNEGKRRLHLANLAKTKIFTQKWSDLKWVNVKVRCR